MEAVSSRQTWLSVEKPGTRFKETATDRNVIIAYSHLKMAKQYEEKLDTDNATLQYLLAAQYGSIEACTCLSHYVTGPRTTDKIANEDNYWHLESNGKPKNNSLFAECYPYLLYHAMRYGDHIVDGFNDLLPCTPKVLSQLALSQFKNIADNPHWPLDDEPTPEQLSQKLYLHGMAYMTGNKTYMINAPMGARYLLEAAKLGHEQAKDELYQLFCEVTHEIPLGYSRDFTPVQTTQKEIGQTTTVDLTRYYSAFSKEVEQGPSVSPEKVIIIDPELEILTALCMRLAMQHAKPHERAMAGIDQAYARLKELGELGVGQAYFVLGYLYLECRRTEQADAACKYLKRAYDMGQHAAIAYLGWMYHLGIHGVQQDLVEAFYCYKGAAKHKVGIWDHIGLTALKIANSAGDMDIPPINYTDEVKHRFIKQLRDLGDKKNCYGNYMNREANHVLGALYECDDNNYVAAVGYYARANKHDLYQTYLRIGKKLCGADKPDIDFALKLFNKIPFDAGPIYVEARLEIKKLQSG